MIKKTALALLILAAEFMSAKQVKFSVDMTGQTVSANGVHIVGDFQAAVGLGQDWDPATATMTQEGTTNIYSIVINLPAFKKYEYRFVNGDQSYEAEFVPEESRVGYNFVDNRWLYVDSINSSVTAIGAIVFGGNAPAGKKMVRLKVNMGLQTVPASGVHLTASYQGSTVDPTATRLYSFDGNVYEVINYVTAGTFTYNFYNGNTLASVETLSGTCATAGHRTLTISNDSIIPALCFSSCSACVGVGIKENSNSISRLTIYPNPAKQFVTVRSGITGSYSLQLRDYTGVSLVEESGITEEKHVLDLQHLKTGIYFISIQSNNGIEKYSKLVLE
jgi:hypothetical protein